MGKSNNSWSETSAPQHVVGANEVTRVPVGAEIRQGVLISNNDIRIDGRFYGSVLTRGKVILGEQATLKGDIVCENADIYGTMEGDLIVGDVLTLMGSCYFSGVIKINKFVVESGAKFDGSSQYISKEIFDQLYKEAEAKVNKEVPAIELEIEKKRAQSQTFEKKDAATAK